MRGQKSGSITASPVWCGPKTTKSSPSGPATNARAELGAIRIASSWAHLRDPSLILTPTGAREDHEDLLGVLVAVAEGLAQPGRQPLVAQAGADRAERSVREPCLALLGEPEPLGHVLDILEVDERVPAPAGEVADPAERLELGELGRSGEQRADLGDLSPALLGFQLLERGIERFLAQPQLRHPDDVRLRGRPVDHVQLAPGRIAERIGGSQQQLRHLVAAAGLRGELDVPSDSRHRT